MTTWREFVSEKRREGHGLKAISELWRRRKGGSSGGSSTKQRTPKSTAVNGRPAPSSGNTPKTQPMSKKSGGVQKKSSSAKKETLNNPSDADGLEQLVESASKKKKARRDPSNPLNAYIRQIVRDEKAERQKRKRQRQPLQQQA